MPSTFLSTISAVRAARLNGLTIQPGAQPRRTHCLLPPTPMHRVGDSTIQWTVNPIKTIMVFRLVEMRACTWAILTSRKLTDLRVDLQMPENGGKTLTTYKQWRGYIFISLLGRTGTKKSPPLISKRSGGSIANQSPPNDAGIASLNGCKLKLGSIG
jgi:hypothetical protein